MPLEPTQLQNISNALGGFSAGLQGNLPQFMQTQQNMQVQQQQMKAKEEEMAIERQKTMFVDAQAALRLAEAGDYESVVKLGMHRLQMLKQFQGVDPSDTQRLTQLAIAARNGSEEAAELLKGELLSAVQIGTAIGVLKAPEPEIIPNSAISNGQVVVRNPDGTTSAQAIEGYQAEAKDRETAQDQNGILRFVDDGTPVFPEVATVADGLANKDRFDRAKVIRSEIDTANKDFTQIANSWDRIAASADSPSAAGDLALIFNFMKMLDPGSTVREGEFATAQSAAGVPDRIRSAYNRVINGERLTPSQRTDFFGQAQNIFDAADTRAKGIRDEYVRLAERSGLSREDVVVERGAAPVIDHGKIGRFTVVEIPEGQ